MLVVKLIVFLLACYNVCRNICVLLFLFLFLPVPKVGCGISLSHHSFCFFSRNVSYCCQTCEI